MGESLFLAPEPLVGAAYGVVVGIDRDEAGPADVGREAAALSDLSPGVPCTALPARLDGRGAAAASGATAEYDVDCLSAAVAIGEPVVLGCALALPKVHRSNWWHWAHQPILRRADIKCLVSAVPAAYPWNVASPYPRGWCVGLEHDPGSTVDAVDAVAPLPPWLLLSVCPPSPGPASRPNNS